MRRLFSSCFDNQQTFSETTTQGITQSTNSRFCAACWCFSLINFDVHTQFSRVYLISIIPFDNFILLLQVNFLLCQFLALFLASIFRSYLHPSKVSFEVRHTFALSLGLAFGYFCFGQQAIHIAGLPAICYIVIRTQDPRIVQR